MVKFKNVQLTLVVLFPAYLAAVLLLPRVAWGQQNGYQPVLGPASYVRAGTGKGTPITRSSSSYRRLQQSLFNNEEAVPGAPRRRALHGHSNATASGPAEGTPMACEPIRVHPERSPFICQMLYMACVDQGTIISKDPKYHPWSSAEPWINFTTSDLGWNLPSKKGIGDRWQKGILPQPQVQIRPWHDYEESPDVAHPEFSKCTLPFVFWTMYPYNPAEVFRYAANGIYALQYITHMMDNRVTLVSALPLASRMPHFTRFWLRPFSKYEPTTLSRLSDRHMGRAPSNSTAEGRHVRCFERMVLCKLDLRPANREIYDTAQYIAHYYWPAMGARQQEFAARLNASAVQVGVAASDLADASVLKVVFAVRGGNVKASGRGLINEEELLTNCNLQVGLAPKDLHPRAAGAARNASGAAGNASRPSFAPAPASLAQLHADSGPGAVRYKRVACVRHVFGADNLYDAWLMQQVDAVAGVHGAALTNGLFLRPGASVLEFRPAGFSGRKGGGWANIYMHDHTLHRIIHWYAIDALNETLSTPGPWEADPKPWYNTYHVAMARDRNVAVPWPALRHQLLNIMAVSGVRSRYARIRAANSYYITDDVKPLMRNGEEIPQDYWASGRMSAFQDPDEERMRVIDEVPLPPANVTQQADGRAQGRAGWRGRRRRRQSKA